MKHANPILIAALAACLFAGCVEREMTITTQPAGAIVYISHQEVGRSPVTIPFTYYGDYAIELRKEGYKTLKTSINLNSPWYQKPGIDFWAEISPQKFVDRREKLFVLETLKPKSTEELLEAARKLREETNRIEPPAPK